MSEFNENPPVNEAFHDNVNHETDENFEFGESIDHDGEFAEENFAISEDIVDMDDFTDDSSAPEFEMIPEYMVDPEVARQELNAYMQEKGYAEADYDAYSQDPKWRHYQLYIDPEAELPEILPENLQAQYEFELNHYMEMNGYTDIDQETYGQDPVWRELYSQAYPLEELPELTEAGKMSEAYYQMSRYMEENGIDPTQDIAVLSQDPNWRAWYQTFNPDVELPPLEYIGDEDVPEVEIYPDEYFFPEEDVAGAPSVPTFNPKPTYDPDEEIVLFEDEEDIKNFDESTIWSGHTEAELQQAYQNVQFDMDAERLDRSLACFEDATWQAYTDEEKRNAINDFAEYVIDIVGFKNRPAVQCYSQPVREYGGYQRSAHTIRINEYMWDDSEEAIDTIAHELWHAHQYECAQNPICTLDYKYKYNIDNYIAPSMGHAAYRDQLIEAEARTFAQEFKNRLRGFNGRVN